jgi:hypothetical protein
MRSAIFLLLIFAFFGARKSEATYLRLTSQWTGEQYTLRNDGDEEAFHVRPYVKAGNWIKEFPDVDLTPGAHHEWRIPLTEIQKQMPRGRSPLSVLIRYQDANGYAFSVPELRPLQTPDLNTQELKTLAENPLRASMTVESLHEKNFRIRYELENTTDKEISVTPQLWIPEEMSLQAPVVPLQVQSHAKMESHFRLHNDTALDGSYYNIFATFSFSRDGLMNFVEVAGGVQIKAEAPAEPMLRFHFSERWWWVVGGFAFFLGWFALSFFCLRPLHGGTPYLFRKR